ncbi:uncharacterized protein LOC114736715 [Neltuma alba]|uniref:uncharacterized protein LOC114736715 n=1 Tax=Neltuma alba TaxID=207710 RepID=UPI0010A3465C|nr:uncharacterized protein LOC114736715 [Prosopis alba]
MPCVGLIAVYAPEENAFFATKAFKSHPKHPFVDLAVRRFSAGKVPDGKAIYVRCGVGLTSLSNDYAVIVIRGLSDLAGAQEGDNHIDLFGSLGAANAVKTAAQFCSLRASCAPNSAVYGGWDDLEIASASEGNGESDVLRDFLNSVGLDDRKNIFVFLLGLVCALAISRVKVSSIILLPASVLVFATGFTVGFFRDVAFSFDDARTNRSKERVKDENLNLSAEKLRSLVKFFDELDSQVNNLKSDVQRAVRNNKIKVADLDGYVKVTDSIRLSALNARNIVTNLIESEEHSSGVLVGKHKPARRKKEVGEIGYWMLQSIGNLIGENSLTSNSTKVRENITQETTNKEFSQTRGNNSTPLVKGESLNSVHEPKTYGNLDSSHDSLSMSDLGAEGKGSTNASCEKEILDSDGQDRSAKRFPDKKEYRHRQNNSLQFSDSHSFSVKFNSSSIRDIWEPHDNLLDSECTESESSFVHEQMINSAHETHKASHKKGEYGTYGSPYTKNGESSDNHCNVSNDLFTHESELNVSSSSKISNDIVFDGYLAEATDLLKQAKECMKGRCEEDQAEIMLYKSAKLLSRAVGLKPMSLLAVGQLGNTYLLHGELKLKSSRDLRMLLSGSITSSSGKQSRILNRLQNKITSKENLAPMLIDICEECEELLIEAGRKYKLALSIDGNDVRALYNWGLALFFRGQLISDIGPAAAYEADRVFLAAIDKFNAMLSKGNVYAPDALYRWGVALQQRSRLRPSSSKEKVKLLQQAKRLYEDALYMDSDNIQLRDALSTCVTELKFRQLR